MFGVANLAFYFYICSHIKRKKQHHVRFVSHKWMFSFLTPRHDATSILSDLSLRSIMRKGEPPPTRMPS